MGVQNPPEAAACPTAKLHPAQCQITAPRGCWDPIPCTPSSCTLRRWGERLRCNVEAVTVVCAELPSVLFPSDHVHRCPKGSMALAAGCPLCSGQAVSSLAWCSRPPQCPFSLLGTEVWSSVAGGLHIQLMPSARLHSPEYSGH